MMSFDSKTICCLAKTLHDTILKLFFKTLVHSTGKHIIAIAITIHDNYITVAVFML